MNIIDEFASLNQEMTDIERLSHLQWALRCVAFAGVKGEIVEAGCHAGRTSAFLATIMKRLGLERGLHLFDSFEGLPSPSIHDRYFQKGDLEATPASVLEIFGARDLPAPYIHAGWFCDRMPTSLPSQIAFAYVDAGFYDSTFTAVESIYPRLSPGGLMIIDDYADPKQNPRAWDELPGVKIACDEVLENQQDTLEVIIGSGNLAFGLLRKSHRR